VARRFTVQVDTTPPLGGAVNDSAAGTPDIDYQQSTTLKASFSGFTDPDSGIRSYVYRWSDRCLAGPDGFDLLNLSHPLSNTSEFSRATTQTVSWEAPGPGFYVVTAVAYNNAWSASRVVCSGAPLAACYRAAGISWYRLVTKFKFD